MYYNKIIKLMSVTTLNKHWFAVLTLRLDCLILANSGVLCTKTVFFSAADPIFLTVHRGALHWRTYFCWNLVPALRAVRMRVVAREAVCPLSVMEFVCVYPSVVGSRTNSWLFSLTNPTCWPAVSQTVDPGIYFCSIQIPEFRAVSLWIVHILAI